MVKDPKTMTNRMIVKDLKNEVNFGARELLFRMSGVDLTQIEWINETTALVILSELGIDLKGYPET